MYFREESEYYRAKIKAARVLGRGWVKPADLPSNSEIRDQILSLARVLEGQRHLETLRQMRIAGLRMMRMLQRFRPRIIGSVLTGHIRHGSDIDLHLFSDSVESVRAELEFHGLFSELTEKRVVKQGERAIYRHLHVHDAFSFDLTVYPADKLGHVFKSSITGKPIESASIPNFEVFLKRKYPNIDLESVLASMAQQVDPFQLYYCLLLPLEHVKQPPQHHPEGNALYHSLQVFDLACDELPYDVEFLIAALLHDIGKAIDPFNHVQAGLEAVAGYISTRTAWLIENHMLAHKIQNQMIGARAHRRLKENESYEELLLLAQCDRNGRRPGVQTTTLEDAIDYLRDISDSFACD